MGESEIRTGSRLVTRLELEQLEQIEEHVAEIRRCIPGWVWDGRSLPVPVDQIVRELYNLRVRVVSIEAMREVIGEDPEGHVGLSGLLLSGEGQIWVSEPELEYDWGERRHRFTVGHELGHFVMHREGRQSIFCRGAEDVNDGDGAGAPDENEPVPRPVPEVEANTFSAALLMPLDEVRTRLSGDPADPVAELKTHFGVNNKPAVRRLEAIRLLA